VPRDFHVLVVIHSHKSLREAEAWARGNADVLHARAPYVFTPINDSTVVYEYGFVRKKLCYQLSGIIHPHIFPPGQYSDDTFDLARSIFQDNPCTKTTLVGENKRGSGLMKSVGFNMPKWALGAVKTYTHHDTATMIRVWEQAKGLMSRVEENATLTMGPTPMKTFRDLVKTLYFDPVRKEGHDVAACQPPILGMSCHNLHQTCNTGVHPHLDENDLYTLICWTSRGQVTGPFVLHAIGLFVNVQVRRLHFFSCLITHVVTNAFWCLQNGTAIFLRSDRVVHGTPSPVVVGDGKRYGIAFVTQKATMTRSRNIACRTGQTPWMDEVLPSLYLTRNPTL
jgi:hypothetical protein